MLNRVADKIHHFIRSLTMNNPNINTKETPRPKPTLEELHTTKECLSEDIVESCRELE